MLFSPHCDVQNITDSLSALRGFKLSRSRSVKSLMACLEPFVAAFPSSTSVQSLSRFNGLHAHAGHVAEGKVPNVRSNNECNNHVICRWSCLVG